MRVVREFALQKMTANCAVYFEEFDASGPEAIARIYLRKNVLVHATALEDGGEGHYPERIRVTVEEVPSVQTPEVAQQSASLSQETPRDNGA